MKKLLCLLLSVVMIFSLCACFNDNADKDDDEDVRGEIIQDDEKEQADNNDDANKEAEEDDNAEEEEEEEEEPQFSLGTTNSNTYRNKFLGLSCTLPSSWVFYTDEQIKEINNFATDLAGEEYAAAVENATLIYDMFASDETTGNNININMEKLNSLQVANLNLKDSLEAQIDLLVSSYENMGYTNVCAEYEKITVDGKAFDALTISAEIYGIEFHGVTFSFLKGNYCANVAVCTMGEDAVDTILGYFTVA